MKYLFLFIIYLYGFWGFAQNTNTCSLRLKLVDQDNYPIAFSDFTLVDNETKAQIKDKTNEYGNADIQLEWNKSYLFSYKEAKDYMQIDIPENSSFIERTIVLVTVGNLSNPPDTIYLKNPPKRAAQDNEASVNQTWIDKNKMRIRNMPVSLYNKITNKVYVSVSDEMGNTRFLVPEGLYFMSVGQLHNYKVLDLKKTKDIAFTNLTTFIRTDIKETVINDTIVQQLDPNQEGTSESGLLIFKLRDFEKKPLPGELVWINQQGSNKVYQAVTDNYGIAKFLLPKGLQYEVSLKYSRAVERFGFPMENVNQIHQFGYSYLGSKTIEKFYEEVKRTDEGFQTEFKSIPIQKISQPLNVVEYKPYGFNLNFKKNTACSPPVIAEDHIFVSGGYHSHDFFSFDSHTGKVVWGIEFAEAGASPSVYMDGILLINTESCTLYAIETSTGKLLWSKWLGPNIYSTPTAANGMVYTVYPRTLKRYDLIPYGLNPFVLVAFDLKTGNIAWQQGIDNDVIAAPVSSSSGLYLTTLNGSLYRFDNKTGKLLCMERLNAVNQPTVFDNEVTVATSSPANKEFQQITVLDTNKLTFIKNIKSLTGKYNRAYLSDPLQRMGFMDGRMVQMQGKGYSLVDGNLVCFNSQTYQEFWRKKPGNYVLKSFYSTPTVLKNQVLVPTSNGKILVYDAKTGNNTKTFSTNYSFWSAPMVHNGWIYIATIDGQIVSINTKDPKNYTGWPQWGMDASHNLWVK